MATDTSIVCAMLEGRFHSLLLQTLCTCEPEAYLALLWWQPIVFFADVRPVLCGRIGQPRHGTVTRVLRLLSRTADFSSRKRQAPLLGRNSRLPFVTKSICSSNEGSETSLHSKIVPKITNDELQVEARLGPSTIYSFNDSDCFFFGKYAPC